MSHRSALFVAAVFASLVPACMQGDAPPAEGPEVDACPVVTNATPTHHAATVSRDETWTAAASPHVVQWETSIAEGATLTIEPCARVVFRHDAALNATRAGARLVAEGTARRPITFAGDAGARWGKVAVSHPARATLRYVRLSGGGGDRFHRHGTLSLRGDGATPAQPVALLDHVTIEDSLGPGVVVERTATFAPGSTDLTVTRAGTGGVVPFAVWINEHAIDGLPSGQYTGNAVDEILVDPTGANGTGGLQEDATMRDRGVPYRIGSSSVDRFNIGAGGRNAPRQTTLTVEAGVVMRFTPGTRMNVELYTGDFPASGALRALGTAERPIVMTSAAERPRPGDWSGLWYGGVASANNRLEHVSLEFTGYDCSCVLSTCSAVERHDAAVILTAQPSTAFIRNVRFANGHGHGVFRGWVGAASPDFTETNTFDAMGGCPQTLPASPTGCTPRVACR